MIKKRLISLNWIEQYGLQIVEKDVETPLLIVPTELFNKLKYDIKWLQIILNG